MSMVHDIFAELGIKVQDIAAGFAGGVVNALIFGQSKPWAIVTSVVAGAFTAAYLSDPVSHVIGTTGGASGFIVGVSAMALVQGIIGQVTKWAPNIIAGKTEG